MTEEIKAAIGNTTLKTTMLLRGALHLLTWTLTAISVYYAITVHLAILIATAFGLYSCVIKWLIVSQRGTWYFNRNKKIAIAPIILSALMVYESITKPEMALLYVPMSIWLILGEVHDQVFFKKIYPHLEKIHPEVDEPKTPETRESILQ